jgi:hypothetical protein
LSRIWREREEVLVFTCFRNAVRNLLQYQLSSCVDWIPCRVRDIANAVVCPYILASFFWRSCPTLVVDLVCCLEQLCGCRRKLVCVCVCVCAKQDHKCGFLFFLFN